MLICTERTFGRSTWRSSLADCSALGITDDAALSAVVLLKSGQQITRELGLRLMNETPLIELQSLAHSVKVAKFGNEVFFNSNLHVNTTNICTLACRFCAFRRGEKAADAYSLNIDEYLKRIEPFAEYIDEVHSVGGLHPTNGVKYHVDLIRAVKERYPHISMKCLTAVEIKHIAEISDVSIKDTLSSLLNAGLDSLPGGGAEILNDSVREVICYGKESSEEYLEIHRTAHILGLPSNCTMLFGTIESAEDRIDHLISLRELANETAGFQCFIPYPFLPDHSRLPQAQLASGTEILRTIAISRLMLDNIPHIKAYRMNLGNHIAQLALHSGADDIDGTVGHEEIMHAAGSKTGVDDGVQELAALIQSAGGIPIRRNTIYSAFSEFVNSEVPINPIKPLRMVGQ